MLRHRFPQGVLWTGNGPRLATAVLLFLTTAVEPLLATSAPHVLAQQTPSSGAEQAAPHYSMEDLSYLLEPVALYPDPLLALILWAVAEWVAAAVVKWVAAGEWAVAEWAAGEWVAAVEWAAGSRRLVWRSKQNPRKMLGHQQLALAR